MAFAHYPPRLPLSWPRRITTHVSSETCKLATGPNVGFCGGGEGNTPSKPGKVSKLEGVSA